MICLPTVVPVFKTSSSTISFFLFLLFLLVPSACFCFFQFLSSSMYIEPDVSPLPDENSNTKRRYGGPTLKEKGFQVPSSRGNLLFSRHYDSQPSEVYDLCPSRDADSIQWCARNGAKGKPLNYEYERRSTMDYIFLFSFFFFSLTLFFN